MRIIISIPDKPDTEVRCYAAAISAAEIVSRYGGASLRIETDNGELIRELHDGNHMAQIGRRRLLPSR